MERYYLAALQKTGLSTSRIKTLVKFFGSANSLWQADRLDLFSCGCIDEVACNNLLAKREKIDIEKLVKEWDNKGIKIIGLSDTEYPALLKKIYNPPILLYYKGILPGDKQMIAVVGARKASVYGRNSALMLAGELAANGIGIVSGAARGIDSAAHQGALKQKGYTIAVLGCGVDVVYPQENSRLLTEIADTGAVFSEYPPGTRPLPYHFPARNRLISGIATGVLVVEAAEKSGSLITADFALEEGRDVFAVPGGIFSENSKGANRLIKQGAKLVESAGDILDEYGLLKLGNNTGESKVVLNREEKFVYEVLSLENPIGIEEIVIKTKLSPQVVTYVLLRLELKELVEQYGGHSYIRVPGRESVE